jgi:hypothetical protein
LESVATCAKCHPVQSGVVGVNLAKPVSEAQKLQPKDIITRTTPVVIGLRDLLNEFECRVAMDWIVRMYVIH